MRDATELLVARRVKELREARGFSRYELARRAGVAVNQVSRVESLERSPSISTLARFAAALEVPLTSLVQEGRSTEPRSSQVEVTNLVRRLGRLEAGRRRVVVKALQGVLDACLNGLT